MQNSQSINVSCKFYSGCYGGENSNIGDLLVTRIQCPIRLPSLSRKQVIFVVDESGSMSDTIQALRASLFAARNSFLRLAGHNLVNTSEEARDQLFSEECTASIITFSNEATLKWESSASKRARLGRNGGTSFSQTNGRISDSFSQTNEVRPTGRISDSFSNAVNNIVSRQSTNMGDGLKMAFEHKLVDYATWIILLTDGVSNKGICQTVDGFTELMGTIPSHTKIIPLGYTTSFDPEILSVLGNMTYLESEEVIAEVFGAITGEIVTCFGINGRITIPNLPSQSVNPDDMIIVPDRIVQNPVEVIGSTDMGCLFNERRFMYGILPWGNRIPVTSEPSCISQYQGLQGTFSYCDIQSMTRTVVPFIIINGGDPIPDDVFENYFSSSKGRTLLRIHNARRKGLFNENYIKTVKARLSDWKHPSALVHKEEILRILNQKSVTREETLNLLTNGASAQNQTTYANLGTYATPSQRTASVQANDDYQSFYPINASTTINPDLLNRRN